MSQYATLMQIRGRLKTSITKSLTFSQQPPPGLSLELLNTRLDRLEEVFKAFTDNTDAILSHAAVPNYLDPNVDYEEYEEKYITARALLLALDRTLRPPVEDVNTTAIVQLAEQQSTFLQQLASVPTANALGNDLPKIIIPRFSGDYKEWPSFSDLFISTVDKRVSLSNTQKFYYLKSFLQGDAAELIRHLAVTESAYVTAWKRLQERYNRPRQIVFSLLDTFMSLPSSSTEDAATLRKLSDGANAVLRGLAAISREDRDCWLIFLLSKKIDTITSGKWIHESSVHEKPTIDQFLTFLESRCDELELNAATVTTNNNKQVKSATKSTRAFVSSNNSSLHCGVCEASDHSVVRCDTFLALSVHERRRIARSKSLCFNCLRPGHLVAECSSRSNCRECHQRHHTLVHSNERPTSAPPAASSAHPASTDPAETDPTVDLNLSNPSSTVTALAQSNVGSLQCSVGTLADFQTNIPLLPTALVQVCNANGQTVRCRALLDCGSELSYITESCIQRLGLSRTHSRISVAGIANSSADTTRGKCQAKIQSCINASTILVQLHILGNITRPLPSAQMSEAVRTQLQGLPLADPTFHTPLPIDILIGGQYVWDILTYDKQVDEEGNTIAISTIFGWVVTRSCILPDTKHHTASMVTMVDLDHSIRRFWEVEDTVVSAADQDDLLVEQHFSETHSRHSDGRYIVHLPLKNRRVQFSNTLSSALSRFYAVERRLLRDPALREQYIGFMTEYLRLGHMRQLSASELALSDPSVFYLPHHPVVGKKLRVVFDGSHKDSNGLSLNDSLFTGPNIQRDLLAVCLRFRLYRFAFSADIVKMFRQIWVAEPHRNYQRIVWREDPAEPIKHFQLCTVTYGTSCAPFLAVRVLRQLAEDYKSDFPVASAILLNDFYVDDVLTGSDCETTLFNIREELITLLSKAGLELSKWVSNCNIAVPEMLQKSPPKQLDPDKNCSSKVLGLHWHPSPDLLSYRVRVPDTSITKRHVLSEMASVFDPLGLLSPFIARLRIFFQELWLTELSWDDSLPAPLTQFWEDIRKDMQHITSIAIPRHIPCTQELELHGFCDASTKAYAAVIYCRGLSTDGEVAVNIVAARVRVAPLKQVSVPRLELCGALLLSRLFHRIKNALSNRTINMHAWTDSTIVLAWLSHIPSRLKTFVGNRTAEILDTLPRHLWRHVTSDQNPADCASRGMRADELRSWDLWWEGPEWLTDPRLLSYHLNNVTNSTPVTAPEVQAEVKPAVLLSVAQNSSDMFDRLLERISSWRRAVRTMGYIVRFIQSCRHHVQPRPSSVALQRNAPSSEHKPPPLTLDELNIARNHLLRYAQTEFHHDIAAIQTNENLKRSSLVHLTPYVDNAGLLRVGGRIQNSELGTEVKHPIILPKNSAVTRLILLDEHERNLHPGVSALFVIIRQHYWILGARNLIRNLTFKCIKCFKQRQLTTQQLMANLPTVRVRQALPFEKTGCDYAGPFTLKLYSGRNARTSKGYICLFVCMVTSAIHLELVTSLTTEAFIAALRVFMARRGLCSEIFSDNGRNFVGASRALNEMYQLLRSQQHNDILTTTLAQEGIRWNFIPPGAPHWGGMWESAVRSVKLHLRRVLGETVLTFEQMRTLLAQIEAVVNSRPLGTAPDDHTSYLSPAHFLIGRPTTLLPEDDLLETPTNRLSYWQHVQAMFQGFWRRWHREYLTSLQQRPKWCDLKPNLPVDSLVLIKEPNTGPGTWPIARVLEVFPGKDGLVRVARLKTKQGETTRPLSKIVPLPIS